MQGSRVEGVEFEVWVCVRCNLDWSPKKYGSSCCLGAQETFRSESFEGWGPGIHY